MFVFIIFFPSSPYCFLQHHWDMIQQNQHYLVATGFWKGNLVFLSLSINFHLCPGSSASKVNKCMELAALFFWWGYISDGLTFPDHILRLDGCQHWCTESGGSWQPGGGREWVEQLVSVTAGCWMSSGLSDAGRTHGLPQQLDQGNSFHLSVIILLTCID